jgi:hypothetical protein
MTDDLAVAPQDSKPGKKGRISKRMKQVLTLLATKGMTQRDAAKQVGMSETYLSAALKKPEIQMFIARKMRETIAVGGLRASTRLVDLIDAGSEHVSADVSRHVLAILGVKPDADAAVNVNLQVNAGYVIDLRELPADRYGHRPLVDVTPPAIEHDPFAGAPFKRPKR